MKIKIVDFNTVHSFDDIKGITFNTSDGQRTILNKHTDCMLALGTGIATIRSNSDSIQLVMSEGLARMEDNVLTLIPEIVVFNKQYSQNQSNPDQSYDDKVSKLVQRLNHD